MLIINNPGNIRLSNEKFVGELQPSVDLNFKQFSDMAYGYRAMFVILYNYAKHGYNTIAKIINRYAPSNENDTAAYIDYVSKMRLHKNPNDIINLSDKATAETLVAAISEFENGLSANLYEVDKGWRLAQPAQPILQKSEFGIDKIFLIGILSYLILKKHKKNGINS